MHVGLLSCLLLPCLTGFTAGCTFDDAIPVSLETAMAPGSADTLTTRSTKMDQITGHHDQGREDRLILVTLANSQHAGLVRETDTTMGSTHLGDADKLPTRYARFLQSLQNRFGVMRVAEWPLSAMGVRCLVLETDGVRTRADIVAALSEVEQIETVQAVRSYHIWRFIQD